MKKIYFLLLVCLCTATVQAQEPRTSEQLSLNLILPSLEWEAPVGNLTTLDLQLGTGFAYQQSNSESEFGIFPVLRGQYRYYYNFNKRLEKGKNISQNSGNYFAAQINLESGQSIIGDLESASDLSLFVGPVWGIQRSYNSGFKWNLSLGAGYAVNDYESYFAPYIGIELGWLLVK